MRPAGSALFRFGNAQWAKPYASSRALISNRSKKSLYPCISCARGSRDLSKLTGCIGLSDLIEIGGRFLNGESYFVSCGVRSNFVRGGTVKKQMKHAIRVFTRAYYE